MNIAAVVTVLAFVVTFPTPTSASYRPSDPFGDHTIELNNEAPLFEVWKFLSDQLLLDKTRFHSCIEQTNASCPEVSTLLTIVDEARQNQGKALLGHLNRSINLMIKPAPGNWTGPLEAITMRDGDCKSYSIAKYAAARVAGISPDHVRLVIVHNRRHNVDHMVAAGRGGRNTRAWRPPLVDHPQETSARLRGQAKSKAPATAYPTQSCSAISYRIRPNGSRRSKSSFSLPPR
jgi:hypothetical protein